MLQNRQHRLEAFTDAGQLALALVQARKGAQLEHEIADPAQASTDLVEPCACAIPLHLAASGMGSDSSARNFFVTALDGVEVAEHERQWVVDFVRDAGHQLTERGHLGRLHQLRLRGLQVPVGGLQLQILALQNRLGVCSWRRLE